MICSSENLLLRIFHPLHRGLCNFVAGIQGAGSRALGGNLPMAGFYSYGELAPNNTTGFCGLHNQTVTLTLIGERAA
jgi:hypothetical protein